MGDLRVLADYALVGYVTGREGPDWTPIYNLFTLEAPTPSKPPVGYLNKEFCTVGARQGCYQKQVAIEAEQTREIEQSPASSPDEFQPELCYNGGRRKSYRMDDIATRGWDTARRGGLAAAGQHPHPGGSNIVRIPTATPLAIPDVSITCAMARNSTMVAVAPKVSGYITAVPVTHRALRSIMPAGSMVSVCAA